MKFFCFNVVFVISFLPLSDDMIDKVSCHQILSLTHNYHVISFFSFSFFPFSIGNHHHRPTQRHHRRPRRVTTILFHSLSPTSLFPNKPFKSESRFSFLDLISLSKVRFCIGWEEQTHMKDSNSNSDLFDPVMVMEFKWSHSSTTFDANFSFAFNDNNFSNRVLWIEIMNDPVDAHPDFDANTTIAD